MLRLLPLSFREAEGHPQAALPWDPQGPYRTGSDAYEGDLWPKFLRGSYPELVANPERDIHLWHTGYVQTYLERDVRSLRQVGNLSQYQLFLRALAARTAQLLSLTDLARDLGVSLNTVKAWLSVLEATYQVIVLRPYFANVGKRLVKRPKVYFSDVVTLCYLTGLQDPAHAAAGPLGGAIMETAVLSEIVKTLTHSGIELPVYLWRTSAGSEVDIVVESQGRLIPVEVKLSATPRPAMATAIKSFLRDFSSQAMPGYVVHPGKTKLPLGSKVMALPFSEL